MDKQAGWFNDPQLQRQFERAGYVVVDVLAPPALAQLRQTGEQLAPFHSTPFHSSIFTGDLAYRTGVSEQIEAALAPAVARLFCDAQMAFSGYVTKQVDPASFVGFHQDWSFVDEIRHEAATLWAPLHDVDTRNGCLLVVPGSHKLNRQVRGFNTNFPYEALIPTLLRKHTLAVPLRAGQAIIFSQRLFHASNPNMGSRMRLCINTLVVPRSAQLYYNFVHGEGADLAGMVECFAVDKAWYQTYQWGSCPPAEMRLSLSDECCDPVGPDELAGLPDIVAVPA